MTSETTTTPEEPTKPVHDPAAMLAIFGSLDKTPEVRETYTRAPLGYPGSKAKSIEKILPHLPYRGGYCEPCGGTASVLLARHQSDIEIFNDRYAGIVAFYRCIHDPKLWIELKARIEMTVHSREEFIWCRDTWEDTTDSVERAARWYYMHQNSFGKQGRHFGRAIKGKGQHGNAMQNNTRLFAPVHQRLRNVQIENLDWRLCLEDFDSPEMVFYIDPTYVKFARGMYTHNFSTADHKELIERIQNLQGFVALSGYADDETRAIYDRYPWDHFYSWQIRTSSVGMAFTETNNLLGKEEGHHRHLVTEALWIREAK